MGSGYFKLDNTANFSVNFPIWFFTDFEFISGSSSANDTIIPLNNTEKPFYDEEYGDYFIDVQEFMLEFPPLSSINLNIEWNFTSGYDQAWDHRIFHTGYTINGGEYWGHQPIEWEQIKFNFHTNNFFVRPSTIRVNIRNDSTVCEPGWAWYRENWIELTENASEEQTQYDTRGIPNFTFYAENISQSINIHIVNGMPSSRGGFSPISQTLVWTIAIASIIGVSILGKFVWNYWKKRRN
jgi:hypothetical protein